MATKEDIGLKIKTMRMSRGMTQQDLADAVGVSRSAISMWESGSNEPNFEALEALADVFNVPISAFLDSAQQIRITGQLPKSDYDVLEALHQNPKLGMLFNRSLRMSQEDVDAMLAIAERILKERDDN